MTMAAVAVVGAAAIGYAGSQQAASAAQNAQQQNMQMMQQYNQLADPFSTGGNRAQYVQQLNDLMRGGYTGLQNDPNYQALNKIGLEGVQRSLSARGMGMGTNEIQSLRDTSVNTMMEYFNQQYGVLSSLSGATGGAMRPVQGMSPMMAGQMAYAPYQSTGELLGTLGMSRLYGGGGTSGTTGAGGMGMGGGLGYNDTSGMALGGGMSTSLGGR